MKKLLAVGLLALVECSFSDSDDGVMVRAISPDGRNEIRLWTDSLAYEVARDGVVVVAKTEIGMKVDGQCLMPGAERLVRKEVRSGSVATPVYKKAKVDLSGNETVADFGDWGVRLSARNDGVAYRFETKKPGKITVNCEKATVRVPCPEAEALVYKTRRFGNEGCLPKTMAAGEIETKDGEMVCLPFVYSVGGKTVAVTEADGTRRRSTIAKRATSSSTRPSSARASGRPKSSAMPPTPRPIPNATHTKRAPWSRPARSSPSDWHPVVVLS